MTNQMALILLGVITVVLSVLMTRTARTVFRKTGVNPIGGGHKFLWYVEMLPLFYGITALSDEKGAAIAIILGSVLVFSVLHTLLSMKAGLSNAILMGILQGVAGGLAALLNVFVQVANVALKSNIKLFSVDLPASSQSRQTQVQSTAEAQLVRQARAEAVAQKAGFWDADEAENADLDTGAYYR